MLIELLLAGLEAMMGEVLVSCEKMRFIIANGEDYLKVKAHAPPPCPTPFKVVSVKGVHT